MDPNPRLKHLRLAGAYSLEAKKKMEAVEEWKQSRAKRLFEANQ